MEKVNILNCVDIINDSVKYYDGKRPFLSTGDLNISEIVNLDYLTFEEKPSRANLNVSIGDIIMARMQGTTKVYAVDKEYSEIIVSTGFLVLRPKNNVDKKYLFQFFLSKDFQNEKDRLCTGATQKAINNANFSKIEIPLPSLSEQKAIAEKLDKAQEIIRYNEEIIAQYDALTQSLFINMFGSANPDFNNWREVKIEDVVKNVKGSMRSGPFGSDLLHSEFIEKGIPVLGIDNAVTNKFQWKQRRFISEEKYQKLKRYTVFPDDIIITIMGTVGRVAVVPSNIGIAINSKHLAAITLNQSLANPSFIAFSLHSDKNILSQINQKGKGAIMTGLNLTIIKELRFRLPPITLQNQFAERVAAIEAQKQLAQQSLAKSQDLFNSLLQQSFKS